jgi:hypothetical protein
MPISGEPEIGDESTIILINQSIKSFDSNALSFVGEGVVVCPP